VQLASCINYGSASIASVQKANMPEAPPFDKLRRPFEAQISDDETVSLPLQHTIVLFTPAHTFFQIYSHDRVPGVSAEHIVNFMDGSCSKQNEEYLRRNSKEECLVHFSNRNFFAIPISVPSEPFFCPSILAGRYSWSRR